MAETHAVYFHGPVDYRAAGLTGAQAVPEILLRRDHQRGAVVVVKWAAPQPIGAVTREFNAGGFDQPLYRYLSF